MDRRGAAMGVDRPGQHRCLEGKGGLYWTPELLGSAMGHFGESRALRLKIKDSPVPFGCCHYETSESVTEANSPHMKAYF